MDKQPISNTPASTTSLTFHRSTGDQLSATQVYDLLRLRVDVFVVEQACPYAEVDGLDLLPTTEHLWLADDHGVAATVRLLDDPAGRRIGRVATRFDCRGQRLAGQLLDEALITIGEGASLLEAQSYLVDFYASFGFEPAGAEYLEDGIPHVPMVRAAQSASQKQNAS
ncbi:MAG: GNAT family N-acetyltransferase [Acidimicrobiales bacterium]